MNTAEDYNIVYPAGNIYFSHACTAVTKPSDYYRHNHSRYELYVFFGGEADFVIEDKLFRLRPNTLLLIPPHIYHYASVQQSAQPYHRLVVNFEHSAVSPELHSLLNTDINPALWDEEMAALLQTAEQHVPRYASHDAALVMQLLLNSLLLKLKYATRKANTGAKIFNPTITQILNYINEHLYEPLSLKEIARHTFLNPSYISQLFASQMKIGIMDYVKQKKIFLAEEMIRSQKISPTEACARLGFSDYSTFYRVYRKYVGASPAAAQKND